MRHAPSVTYPVRRSQAAVALVALVWGFGACAALLACLPLAGAGWRQAVPIACVAMVGLFAWRSLSWHPSDDLIFDGEHWSMALDAPAPEVQITGVEVALDLQFVMLLRLSGRTRALRWLWLTRRSMPARWRDLRRAVYSRAPVAPPLPRRLARRAH